MSSLDFKKEWFAKARIDYFSPFITLWLSCNSWYNFHYSLADDRAHINKVKSDFSSANKLFKEFERLFTSPSTKAQTNLFANLELLHYSLSGRSIHVPKLLGALSFENVLVDYNQKSILSAYESLLIKNAKTKTGKVKAKVKGTDLGGIVITSDPQKVFAGLFEMIYQVRCLLVHGDMQPTEENHEVIKYCYLILADLMKPFCG